MIKKIYSAVLAVSLMSVATISQAGVYVGASAGSAGYDSCNQFNSDAQALGLTDTSCDDNDTGGKLFGGYQFNPNFAVEGAYYDLGSISGEVHGLVNEQTSLGTLPRLVQANINVKVTGFGLAAVGVAPVGGSFALFGKLGGFFWNIDTRTSINNVEESFSGNGVGLLTGIGASYQFSKSVSARVEYELMKDVGDSEDTTGKGDISLVSVGIAVHFH